jgi:hypothetical protein
MSAPIEAIERTLEYENFMKELRDFHDRKGYILSSWKIRDFFFFLLFIISTALQAEPVLGGKKLDLLRIYKTVLEAGGYEKVRKIKRYPSQR